MNEKIYKSMTFAGVSNIAVGVSGARLLKEKKKLTF